MWSRARITDWGHWALTSSFLSPAAVLDLLYSYRRAPCPPRLRAARREAREARPRPRSHRRPRPLAPLHLAQPSQTDTALASPGPDSSARSPRPHSHAARSCCPSRHCSRSTPHSKRTSSSAPRAAPARPQSMARTSFPWRATWTSSSTAPFAARSSCERRESARRFTTLRIPTQSCHERSTSLPPTPSRESRSLAPRPHLTLLFAWSRVTDLNTRKGPPRADTASHSALPSPSTTPTGRRARRAACFCGCRGSTRPAARTCPGPSLSRARCRCAR